MCSYGKDAIISAPLVFLCDAEHSALNHALLNDLNTELSYHAPMMMLKSSIPNMGPSRGSAVRAPDWRVLLCRAPALLIICLIGSVAVTAAIVGSMILIVGFLLYVPVLAGLALRAPLLQLLRVFQPTKWKSA